MSPSTIQDTGTSAIFVNVYYVTCMLNHSIEKGSPNFLECVPDISSYSRQWLQILVQCLACKSPLTCLVPADFSQCSGQALRVHNSIVLLLQLCSISKLSLSGRTSEFCGNTVWLHRAPPFQLPKTCGRRKCTLNSRLPIWMKGGYFHNAPPFPFALVTEPNCPKLCMTGSGCLGNWITWETFLCQSAYHKYRTLH